MGINLHAVVRKLAGPVRPVGDHGADEARFANLERIIGLVDHLIYDLREVANDAGSHEASVKRAGERARDFIAAIGSEDPE